MSRIVTMLAFLAILLCTGCIERVVYVEGRQPVIPLPPRPALQNVPGTEMKKMSEQAQKDVASNFDALMTYAQKLEIAVKDYNAFADDKNQKSGWSADPNLPNRLKRE